MSNISENIKRIRIAKELKQSDIIKKTGLSRQAYINIETGKADPKSTNLIAIANALSVKVQDLLREPQKLSSLRFRINKPRNEKDRSKRIEDEIKLATWLNHYTFLEQQLNCPQNYKLEQIDIKNPRKAASKVREVLGVNDEPILDIITLLEDAGIKIFLFKSSLKNCFGMSLNEENENATIAINTIKGITIERQIFTAAHELGHLIMHKDSYVENINEENQNEEQEADIFASYFLMPDDLFTKKINEKKGHNWIDTILHVKRYFKVSYKTVLKRLIDKKLLNIDNPYQQFAKDYKIRYNHDLRNHYEPEGLEPEGLSKNDFMEDRYKRLVKEAYEKDIITTSKLADMLSVSLEEAKEMIQSWSVIV